MARKPTPKAEAKTEAKLVKMKRDELVYPAPHECDVHPAEIDSYAAGGWVKA